MNRKYVKTCAVEAIFSDPGRTGKMSAVLLLACWLTFGCTSICGDDKCGDFTEEGVIGDGGADCLEETLACDGLVCGEVELECMDSSFYNETADDWDLLGPFSSCASVAATRQSKSGSWHVAVCLNGVCLSTAEVRAAYCGASSG